MSHCTRKPTMWFRNKSDTNPALQALKMARGGKFWIKNVEELYYPCSENKGAFVFAYADSWFSDAAAHICMLREWHCMCICMPPVVILK